MDPNSPKKRPGGAIESPFSESRKVAKTSSAVAHPYPQQPAASDEDMLTAEEAALVRIARGIDLVEYRKHQT